MRAVSLGPKHISAYELTPEPGTPIFDRLQRGSLRRPGEEESLCMARLAEEALSAAGFVRYEISNYALPGFECRHNINYWHRGEYLGLGPGAHSFTSEKRERNTGDIAGYVSELGAGRLPVEESAAVTRREAIGEALFLGLRLTRGVDALTFGEAWGLDLALASAELMEEGLVEIEAGWLRLTKRGLLLFNPVLVRLMERLGL
jgi:oxygen-independent coproporphyrinogen-3 oxidase